MVIKIENYLKHYGILGMKWGRRRTPEQLGNLSRDDTRWVRKNSNKITKSAQRNSASDLSRYSRELMRNPGARTKAGKLSASTINSYNRRMASLMSDNVSGIRSPSGKTVQFVAKRGEVGVFMALADQGYNMDRLKNGIYDSGRVAYKKTVINKVES